MAFSVTGILFVLLELLRPLLVPLSIVISVDVLLVALLVARRGHWRVRPAVLSALLLGASTGIVSALGLPAWTGASLGQLHGLLDFAVLSGAAFGVTVVVALLVYPPVQLCFGHYGHVASVTAPVHRVRPQA